MTRFLPLVWLLLASTAFADPLLVFAAVSTSEPLLEAGRRFREETGRQVTFAFASSSDLARQIQAGAPADVFLSADVRRMNQLVEAGRVRQTDVVPLLGNALVVVVPQTSTLKLDVPDGLAAVETLALADPQTVPAGVYAREWLERTALWGRVKGKVIPTADVRAALTAVATGRADAAIVYRTDARISSKVRIAYQPPPSEQPEIVYPVAPITEEGKEFVRFLQRADVRKIFLQAGFKSAP